MIIGYQIMKKVYLPLSKITNREIIHEQVGYMFDSWGSAYVAMKGIRKERPEEEFILTEVTLFIYKGSSL